MKIDYSLNDWPYLGHFACRCGHQNCRLVVIDRALVHADLTLLERAPEGTLDVVTSGFRCAYWNELSGGNPNSYHMRGKAIDRRCSGILLADAFRILEEMSREGYVGGIGVYLGKGHHPFIHHDQGPDSRRWGRLDGKYIGGMVGVLKVLEEAERRGQ